MTASSAAGRQKAFSTVGMCVAATILLCVFEGCARKWLFPNSSPSVQAIMYFSKDVPLAIAVLVSLGRTGRASCRQPIKQLLFFSSALVFLGALIAAAEGFSLVGAVISFRNLVILPWVAYLISPGLTGRRDLNLILHTIGSCAIVNAGLGGVQFFLPTDHILNQTVQEGVNAVTAIGRVRAYGTFVYISGMADLCVFACWAGVALIIRSPKRWFGYAYATAGLAAASAAMSRHGALEGFAVLALSLAFTRSGRLVGAVLTVLAVIGVLVAGAGGNQDDENAEAGLVNALARRHQSADSFVDRLFSFYGQVPYALAESPTGVGIGITQTAHQVVGGGSGMIVEFDLARVAYEIGLIGFLGSLLFRIGLPLIILKQLPTREPISETGWRAVWWPSLWVLAMMFTLMISANHVLATFLTVVMVCVFAAAEREVVACPDS